MIDTSKNMWRTKGRLNFSLRGLVFYAPLWNLQCRTDPFNAWDVANSTVISCDRTGGVMGVTGFTADGDDNIDCGNLSQLNFGDGASFSLTGWVNSADLGTYRTIISKGTGDGFQACWFIRFNNTGNFNIQIADGAQYRIVYTTAANFDDAAWHHLAVIKDGDTAIYIYVDGSAEATTGSGDALNTVDSMSNAGSVFIGKLNSVGDNFTYTGTIGELIVYNRALSSAEVAHIYNTTKGRYL